MSILPRQLFKLITFNVTILVIFLNKDEGERFGLNFNRDTDELTVKSYRQNQKNSFYKIDVCKHVFLLNCTIQDFSIYELRIISNLLLFI